MITFGDELEEVVGRFPAHYRDEIEDLVDEYMDVLDVHERPTIVIRNNLGSRWLGRAKWKTSEPDHTTIELQRRILDDPRTLERVLAHEMIHHANLMALSADQIGLMRIGIRPPEHGRDFLELADKVNAYKGEDGFVTVRSDEDYVETSDRSYFLLVLELDEGPLAYAWNARLTPKIERVASRWIRNHRGRIVRTNDPRFAGGAKISSGRVSIPKDEEKRAILRRLLEEAA